MILKALEGLPKRGPEMRYAPGACTVDQVQEHGGYPIIYADPAWSYSDKTCTGGVGKEYVTMTPEQIRAMPVNRLAARDAVLFLWGTYPKMPEVLDLIPRWGFTFKSIAFQWIKTRGVYEDGSAKPFLGLGRWTRGNTEPCLLAVKGKPHRISAAVSQLIRTLEAAEPNPDELLVAPVSRHSAKPAETRDKIVKLMGPLARLELFARAQREDGTLYRVGEDAPGWDGWGNECLSDVILEVGTDR